MTGVFDFINIKLDNIELIPYVRMTQRSRFANKYAIAYLLQQKTLRGVIQNDLERKKLPKFLGLWYLPPRTPFVISVYVCTSKRMHRCDLDNLVKASLDLCQGVVFQNDSWCDAITATREVANADQTPYTQIIISPWLGTWEGETIDSCNKC